jgi:hypothetical protein
MIANPVMTGKFPQSGRMGVEGIMFFSIVCGMPEESIAVQHGQAPFSFEVDCRALRRIWMRT